MARFGAFGSLRVLGILLVVTSLSPESLQEVYDSNLSTPLLNCTTTDNFVSFHPTNASRVDESKIPQHRVLKNSQKRRDDQRPNSDLVNQYPNRYLDSQESSRYFDDQRLNKHFDDDDPDKSLKVYPLNTYPNTKELNKDSSEQSLNTNFGKEESNKHYNNQNLNNNFEDEYAITNLNRNRNNKNSSKHIINQYPVKNYEDQYSRKYLDNLYPDRRYKDQNFERHIEDQYQDFSNQDFERHSIDRQPVKFHNNLESDKTFTEQHSDKRLNEYPNKHFKDEYPDRNLDDLNFKKRYNEKSSTRYLDNIDSEKHLKDFKTRVEDPNLNKYPDDLYSDRHFKDSNFGERFDESTPERYPDKRLKDLNFERRLDEQISDKNFNNEHSDERFKDVDFKRGYDKQTSKKNIDNMRSDGHFEDSNFERGLDEQYPSKNVQPILEKHLNEQHPDSNFKNPNFEKRLDESTSNEHLDGLHPDRSMEDQHFQRHLIGQYSDEHLGSDVRTDKRLSDDNYNRHIDKNLNRQNEDHRSNVELEELHPDRRLSDDTYNRHIIDKNLNRENEDHQSNVESEELHPDRRFDDETNLDEYTTTMPRKESNVSHLMTFTLPKDWEENKPKLNFPKKSGDERYKMATLHLDKGLFVFDFLRSFLSLIQPRNIPLDLLKDTLEGKVNISTLIQQSLHLEMAFIGVISVLIVLMFIVPGTELWLCCRSNRYNYQRRSHGSSVFFLVIFTIIIGTCIVTMLICNEEVAGGIDRIPETVEAALQDLRDYHSGTVLQLRKCLTRSLDIASEAILADLDNVEEQLGKPVQAQLSSETGVDVALEALMDVANASQELAYKTDALLKRAERARDFGSELSREADEIRRDLERTSRDCAPEDRSLCAVLDPSGLHLALRLERVARDDRLLRLRAAGRENITEAGRQSRGEYLYVPQHIARTTLEARNQIRREINTARARVSDESRSIEARGSDLSNQLDTVRRVTNQVVPYVRHFEYARWFVGFGTAMCVLLIWLLLFGALCCRCGSSESRVRPTLLWFAFLSCIVSMALWLVLIAALAIASHVEMLLCRPLSDPEFRTVEAILETKVFLGRRPSVPLKDLFEKCEQNDAAYQAFQLDNTLKLEQLTAHWTWTGLSRAFSKLKVDLTGLRILPANLRERLQNLLYACGSNLTEHRIMIQGPILNKDLNALSDQVENVARQLSDRRTARSFQTIAARMRDLMSRRVKPLMKMQDELVYQLATLDLHLQPLQRQVNQSLTHLRSVQYYIDNQGEKIGLLKTKAYVDRLGSYLDQWRAHVLTEMSSGVAKCRPLWDILQGIKLLLCSHILGPLNGFWFATFICVFTMLASTPTAHKLASSYWRPPSNKGSVLLSRQGSPDTVVVERETWRSPDPPPSMDSW